MAKKSKAGRTAKGRFKKLKGRKNPAAVKAGKKGHAKSCGLFGSR